MAAAQFKQTRESQYRGTTTSASRTRVQNGTVRKRRTAQQGSRAVQTLRSVTRRPRARREAAAEVQPLGLSAFGMLVGAGALIACILVVALQWQRNAHQLNRDEVELRSALDVTNDQRQRLLIEQQRAASPRENDLRSRQNGLAPYQFDERSLAKRSTSTPPSPQTKAAIPSAVSTTSHAPTALPSVSKSAIPKTTPATAAPATVTKPAAVVKPGAGKVGTVPIPVLPKAPAVHGMAAKRVN